MELDNINQNDNWNPQPLKITSIVTIVLSSILTLIFFAIIFMMDEFRGEIEKALAEQEQEVALEDVISMIRVIFIVALIPFVLSIIGAVLMLNRFNNGWILLLIAHVIIIMFLFLGLLGNFSPMGVFLFGSYLALTILAGKYRYQKEENFEDYSN